MDEQKENAENILSDKVYCAMETGNFGEARQLLAAAEWYLPEKCKDLRHSIMLDYGYFID